MSRVKYKHIATLVIAGVILSLIGFSLDNRLQMTNYNVYDSRVPAAFEGFKIAQISDMHCLWFGEGQSEIINMIRKGEPNIIILTGDILDVYIRDYDTATALISGLTKIAPVYAVSGNQEEASNINLQRMNEIYKEYSVQFLVDSGTTVTHDGADVFIYGLADREGNPSAPPTVDADTYGILLYHRSDRFDSLKDFGYGLVLSGHSHGGLIRLPLVGGIVAPEGKLNFNLQYTGGLYTAGSTTLISNRGLAGSHGFPRIFNRPEVVFVTLHHAA